MSDHFQITIDALEAKREVLDRAIASLKQLQASDAVPAPEKPPRASRSKKPQPDPPAPTVVILPPCPLDVVFTDLERALLTVLQDGPLPRAAIVLRVKKHQRMVSDALQEMASLELVRRTGSGPRNRVWHALVSMPVNQPALEEP